MNEEILCLATDFGLRIEEVENLSLEDLKYYFNFCLGKSYAISSFLIIGYDKESKRLNTIARNCKFKVATIPNQFIVKDTNVVAFLCSENIAPLTLEKAKRRGTVILKKDFLEKFHTVFFTDTTHSQNADFLFDKNIPIEYRIIKPLSNYDKEIKVNSFSFESDNTYSVNLYKMTCTCKDFHERQRSLLPVGDIRRLCKHLMREYKHNIGLNGLSDFNKNIFNEGYALNKNFKNVIIENVSQPVIINYDTANDWWNIYFPTESGTYKRYGYSPSEKRFSYNEKPKGFVKPLRAKLQELRNQLIGNYSNTPTYITSKRQSNKPASYEKGVDVNSDYYSPPYRPQSQRRIELLKRNKIYYPSYNSQSQHNNTTNQPINKGCFSYVVLFVVICFILSLFKC